MGRFPAPGVPGFGTVVLMLLDRERSAAYIPTPDRPVITMKTDPVIHLDLPSKLTGTTYRLHLPATAPAAGTGEPRPLVLVMDGDDQFGFALAAYEKMRAAGRVPDLLLAGVGYGAGYRQSANHRMRDYTPTAMAGETGTGGAETFRRALRDEIIPFLSQRFAVSPHNRGITGHSLGSLFGLYAFFHPEPLFPCCLASSPSIFYDDRSVLKLEAGFARGHSALSGRLFLSVGEEDSPSMTGDLTLLEEALAARPYAGLTVINRRFAQRDHYNVLPDAFEAGLVALYSSSR
jgi:predicted alpha/beta superfamily hydrolase